MIEPTGTARSWRDRPRVLRRMNRGAGRDRRGRCRRSGARRQSAHNAPHTPTDVLPRRPAPSDPASSRVSLESLRPRQVLRARVPHRRSLRRSQRCAPATPRRLPLTPCPGPPARPQLIRFAQDVGHRPYVCCEFGATFSDTPEWTGARNSTRPSEQLPRARMGHHRQRCDHMARRDDVLQRVRTGALGDSTPCVFRIGGQPTPLHNAHSPLFSMSATGRLSHHVGAAAWWQLPGQSGAGHTTRLEGDAFAHPTCRTVHQPLAATPSQVTHSTRCPSPTLRERYSTSPRREHPLRWTGPRRRAVAG